jgi:hypothetical protein
VNVEHSATFGYDASRSLHRLLSSSLETSGKHKKSPAAMTATGDMIFSLPLQPAYLVGERTVDERRNEFRVA